MRRQLRSCRVHVTGLGWLVAVLGLIAPASGQGLLQNGDFEQAVLVPASEPYLGYYEVGPAFPGWTGMVNGRPARSIIYNDLTIGAPMIGLHGTGTAISGNYTAMLWPAGTGIEVSLSQSALLPADTRSLYFRMKPDTQVQVSLGGVPLTYFPLTTTTNWQSYLADVTAFAGTTAELKFWSDSRVYRPVYLDDIRYTTQAVPEPGPLALFALGGAALAFASWRRGRRSP